MQSCSKYVYYHCSLLSCHPVIQLYSNTMIYNVIHMRSYNIHIIEISQIQRRRSHYENGERDPWNAGLACDILWPLPFPVTICPEHRILIRINILMLWDIDFFWHSKITLFPLFFLDSILISFLMFILIFFLISCFCNLDLYL